MSEPTASTSPTPSPVEGQWELTPPVLDEQLRGVPASRGVIALLAEEVNNVALGRELHKPVFVPFCRDRVLD